MIPLAFARDGSLVRVVMIKGGGLRRRLIELGISEGKNLRVVRSLGHGPVIVESAENSGRLVLGFGVAMKIMVEEVPYER